MPTQVSAATIAQSRWNGLEANEVFADGPPSLARTASVTEQAERASEAVPEAALGESQAVRPGRESPRLSARGWLAIGGVWLLSAILWSLQVYYFAVARGLHLDPRAAEVRRPVGVVRRDLHERDLLGVVERPVEPGVGHLDRVERIPNPAPADTQNTEVLRAAANDIPGVRIIDPNVVSPSFRQLEGQRDYYAFPDTLDVDRYTIEGQTRDAVVAVREMNLTGLPDNQRNWLNDHTVYTHGYGFYAAYGNQRTTEGDPVFFEGGGRTALGEYEPRIYFGELSPEYSVVGAPQGAAPSEFDFPSGSDGDVAVQNTYAGEGGVPMGNFLGRMAYALKYREANFLLSREWSPSGANPRFGIADLMWATVVTSVIAMAIAVPLGVAVALFITYLAAQATQTAPGASSAIVAFDASFGPGFYWFAAYCVVSLAVQQWTARTVRT